MSATMRAATKRKAEDVDAMTSMLDGKTPSGRTAVPATLRFEPLCLRVDDAAALIGLSAGKVWELIAQGRLPARKIDAATVVLYADLQDFVRSAPPAREKAAQ